MYAGKIWTTFHNLFLPLQISCPFYHHHRLRTPPLMYVVLMMCLPPSFIRSHAFPFHLRPPLPTPTSIQNQKIISTIYQHRIIYTSCHIHIYFHPLLNIQLTRVACMFLHHGLTTTYTTNMCCIQWLGFIAGDMKSIMG